MVYGICIRLPPPEQYSQGDLLCEKWERMNEGYEACFPVFRYPKGTPQRRDEYLFMTDTGIYTWSVVK